MLKTDMHMHTKDDPHDLIGYDYRKLIDHAAKKGFQVLSITHHKSYFYPQELVSYAKSKGILMIPGTEWVIEGADVLLYNFSEQELKSIVTFRDLERVKKAEHLVVAPHPFFRIAHGMGEKLYQWHHLVDAIEYHSFYLRFWTQNPEAVSFAKKYKKPMVGNSDTHILLQMGTTYSMVDAKPTVAAFIAAIKAGKVKVVSKPMPVIKAACFVGRSVACDVCRKFSKKPKLVR